MSLSKVLLRSSFVISFIIVLSALTSSVTMQTQLPYRNPQLSIDQRVKDLLGRMTIEEKVAQLTCLWIKKPQERALTPNFDDRGNFSAEKAKAIMPNGVGQIARQREGKSARESAEFANANQKWLIENTRLGIPAIFHDEILHGNMAKGSTVFPVPLALASSWDPDLITKVFTAGALETRVRGSQQVLGPNLDLAREPRWGRTEETYGEDTYLASRMGVAVVRALQGNVTGESPKIDGSHVIATGKHFAGHGQPEGGTNTAPVNLSERLLRETHFKTFEAAIKEANLQSIMPAYHEIDGVPVHGNKWMLGQVLRNEWNFKGLIVSDYDAIAQLQERHHIAADKADAASQALTAGVDIELPDPDTYQTLIAAVKAGKVSESLIDQAVTHVLRAKFQLGLFENPFVDPARAELVTDSAEHRALALEAARRSIVLLKNERNLLPFDRAKLKSIAVIGPNAAKAHLGGYTDPNPPKTVSILDGIKQKLGNSVQVNYAEGCKITKEGGNWFSDAATLNDETDDRRLINEGVQTAKISDAVILVVGGNEDTNKEAWADNHLGDRDSLELVGRQNELVKAVLATGKPTVVFLVNSGPLAVNEIAKDVPAILEGFYLGEEQGTAAADVLFGDYNPGGKLPVSFPRSTGQLPIYYNQKPSAKRGYQFSTTTPLFPFGYGLSYTTFRYSDLQISPKQIKPDGEATVTVNVTNSGQRAGDEVVQLYIRDETSSVTRPVKELKDFVRITLAPKETKRVSFRITPDKLWFYNQEMKRVVESGTFQIMVGADSVNLTAQKLEVLDK
jgi:beta-glucosidase